MPHLMRHPQGFTGLLVDSRVEHGNDWQRALDPRGKPENASKVGAITIGIICLLV